MTRIVALITGVYRIQAEPVQQGNALATQPTASLGSCARQRPVTGKATVLVVNLSSTRTDAQWFNTARNVAVINGKQATKATPVVSIPIDSVSPALITGKKNFTLVQGFWS